jgi:hypothetical protein
MTLQTKYILTGIVIGLLIGAGAGYVFGQFPIAGYGEEVDRLERENLELQSIQAQLREELDVIREQLNNVTAEEHAQKAIQIRGIPIKGVFWYRSSQEQIQADLDSYKYIKKLGANWVQIVLWELVTDDGELIDFTTSVFDAHDVNNFGGIDGIRRYSQDTEKWMSLLVDSLHEMGFKIYFVTYHERMGAHHLYGDMLNIDVDSFLVKAAEKAVNWASFCESHSVEMYAPRKELQEFVGINKALQWDNEILPRIRKVYNGDLVRGAFQLFGWNNYENYAFPRYELSFNLSGWDYLGLDFYGNGVDTLEEMEIFYMRVVSEAKLLKDKWGLKGVVYEELGFPHTGDESFWHSNRTYNDILCEMYRIFFECGSGKIDGFFPWVWEEGLVDLLEDGNKHYIKPDEVISYYYNSSEILPREAISVEIASMYFSEDFFPDYYELQRLIEFDSWYDWEYCKAGPPDVRVISEESGGYVKLFDMVIHPHERLNSNKWTDYLFKGRLKIISGEIYICIRQSLDFSGYSFGIRPLAHTYVSKRDGQGVSACIYDGPLILIELNKWYDFEIIVKDDYLLLKIGETAMVYRDPNPILKGSITIGCGQDNSQIMLEKLSITEIS